MGSGRADGHPVILFDGVCNLCNRWVQFVIRRDPEGVFRFAPLQSAVGEQLLSESDSATDRLDSVVLVEDGEWYTKSDAVLRVARRLGGVYRLLWPFRFLPTRLRNRLYDFVASRRYRWFGKRDRCMMPTPDVESRFLAGGPTAGGDGASDGSEGDTPVGEHTEPG
jgi:predicted DCC family thiol-disulfide oxidoreductase YuxK